LYLKDSGRDGGGGGTCYATGRKMKRLPRKRGVTEEKGEESNELQRREGVS